MQISQLYNHHVIISVFFRDQAAAPAPWHCSSMTNTASTFARLEKEHFSDISWTFTLLVKQPLV